MNETLETLFVQLSDNTDARAEILRRIQAQCNQELTRLEKEPIEKSREKGHIDWLQYGEQILNLFKREKCALTRFRILNSLKEEERIRQNVPRGKYLHFAENTVDRNLRCLVERGWLKKGGNGVYLLA